MSPHAGYLEYLRGRSRAGLLYRRHWLYPRLVRYLHGRVLDVGCGIGDMLAYRPGTVGVDVDPAIVDYCRARGLDAHLMKPDRLPFPDHVFDSVILDNVLEHVASPDPLLAEIRRVLVRGGSFVVGVPGRRGYAADPDHKVFYDEAALAAKLRACGFECRETVAMPFRSTWLDTHARQYCIYAVSIPNPIAP